MRNGGAGLRGVHMLGRGSGLGAPSLSNGGGAKVGTGSRVLGSRSVSIESRITWAGGALILMTILTLTGVSMTARGARGTRSWMMMGLWDREFMSSASSGRAPGRAARDRVCRPSGAGLDVRRRLFGVAAASAALRLQGIVVCVAWMSRLGVEEVKRQR